MPRIPIRAMISAKIFCPRWWTNTASTRLTSSTKTRKKRSTGAMWERWRLFTTPTWISFQSLRSSISTTRSGRSARISGSIRRQNLFSPDVRVNSYSEVESSILFTHVNVGRHCRIRKAILDRDVHVPEGTTIGYDVEADRQRYFVTDTGITVVTRDYSLFENPVTVDYFTSE